jgi:site-specific recombinase XerC
VAIIVHNGVVQVRVTRTVEMAAPGRFVLPSRFLAEHLTAWLDNDSDLSPRTIERYRELTDRQIVPHLGHVVMQRLRPGQVNDWHTALLKSGGTNGRPLSTATVGQAHRIRHRAYDLALRLEKVARNPVHAVPSPRITREEATILNADQVATLLLWRVIRSCKPA